MNHQHYLDAWLKKYYRRTSRLLKCPQKTRQRLMCELQSSVDEFLEDNPDAAPSDIVQHIGTPDQIAQDYLTSLDESELQAQISRVRTTRRVLVVIAIALIIGAVVFFVLYNNWKGNIYYFNDKIVYEETDETNND